MQLVHSNYPNWNFLFKNTVTAILKQSRVPSCMNYKQNLCPMWIIHYRGILCKRLRWKVSVSLYWTTSWPTSISYYVHPNTEWKSLASQWNDSMWTDICLQILIVKFMMLSWVNLTSVNITMGRRSGLLSNWCRSNRQNPIFVCVIQLSF